VKVAFELFLFLVGQKLALLGILQALIQEPLQVVHSAQPLNFIDNHRKQTSV
jgi:hypothetical protein